MPRPLVPLSVIVPTRDTHDLTLRCLATLDRTDPAPAEILLADDGSGDGTSEAVGRAYPTVRIVPLAMNRGFTAAVNAAWTLATQPIVLLLNSDTEVHADVPSRVVDAFVRDARLGIAGASLRYPDGRPQWSAGPEPTAWWLFALATGVPAVLARIPGWPRLRDQARRLLRGGQVGPDVAWLPATAMAVRRAVVEDIGYFDPTLAMYAQDLDYCLRARAAGWRIARLPDVHVVHVQGATIGHTSDATVLRQDPQALVRDLARWIQRAHAPRRARGLCAAMEAGLRLRVATRWTWRWLLRRDERAVWDRDTARYRAAWATLRARD